MQHLGAVPPAGLVAASLAGQVISKLGITAPEAGIAVVWRARGRIVRVRLGKQRSHFRRVVSMALPHLLRFGREVQTVEDRAELNAGDIVALRSDHAGTDKALIGELVERP